MLAAVTNLATCDLIGWNFNFILFLLFKQQTEKGAGNLRWMSFCIQG